MVDIINVILEKNCKFIIVDMTALEFISSAGVGSILGTLSTARDQGGDIVLYGLSEAVKHIFKILDLLDYLTIKDNYNEVSDFCGV